MLRTYEANFSVALYFLITDDSSVDEDEEEEDDIQYSEIIASHTNEFNQCLCNNAQSKYVLKFLKEGYEDFGIADVTISDLIYERTGKFTCKIDIFDELESSYSDSEIEEIIEEVIKPSDLIEHNGITINNHKYAVDIKLDYFLETYYDDDETNNCDDDESNNYDDDDESNNYDDDDDDDDDDNFEKKYNKNNQDDEYNCPEDTSEYNNEDDNRDD